MTPASFSRAGAVDLSALAARAKAGAAPTGPSAGPGAAGRTGGGYVLETSEQGFENDTIRRSMQHPVVVELYSPRVSTGAQLSAALAEIANASDGKFLLARLNVDTAPGIVQALQLQAVPTVIALIGGQVAPLFQGVLPKEQVQAYLDQLLKAAVANGIVGRAEPVGAEPGDAGEADEQGPDPRFAEADAALERGDFDAALVEFDTLLRADPNDAEAKAGRAQVGLYARSAQLDPQAVLTTAATSDALADQLAAADVEVLVGRAEAAFERLVGLVRTRAGDDRNAARLRLLELFETLGPADPRVKKARTALMSALF